MLYSKPVTGVPSPEADFDTAKSTRAAIRLPAPAGCRGDRARDAAARPAAFRGTGAGIPPAADAWLEDEIGLSSRRIKMDDRV